MPYTNAIGRSEHRRACVLLWEMSCNQRVVRDTWERKWGHFMCYWPGFLASLISKNWWGQTRNSGKAFWGSCFSRREWKQDSLVHCLVVGVGVGWASSLYGMSVGVSGEGNGNPLQYSCLENPVDGGAWWAAICGVSQSRTQLKRLSMHACM